MKLFDFFKRKKVVTKEIPVQSEAVEDRSQWTGKDFEFLITGDIDISAEDYDQIMTPNTFEWTKINRENWPYYQVGEDEFSYSWEEPGIQITFNKEITFEKAEKIAVGVIANIRATGQEAELVILSSSKVYRFY